ncbi:MAG: hypothetical protein SVN78_05160 [Deferribacterota bacterium]|nr:hypothetical protein [Deferribacterota bacterium]
MKHADIENYYLTYFKLFDSLNISIGLSKAAFDLSLNNGITAMYLIKNARYERVYVFDKKLVENLSQIYKININDNMLESIRSVKFDLAISLAGILHMEPFNDFIIEVHKSLNVGGKLILAIYPEIYDDSGRDIMGAFEQRKIGYIYRYILNAIKNIFSYVSETNVIQDATVSEIKYLLLNRGYLKYIVNSNMDKSIIFRYIDKTNKRYFFCWNIIEAIKL